jgi:hypothetical protein
MHARPVDAHAQAPLFGEGQNVAALHTAQESGVGIFFEREVAMTMWAGPQ